MSRGLEGVSAVGACWRLRRALLALGAEGQVAGVPRCAGHDRPYGISIGRVSAGDWSSSVPDLLTAEGRYGVRLGEDPAQARAAVEGRVAQAGARGPRLGANPGVGGGPGGEVGSGGRCLVFFTHMRLGGKGGM